MNWRQRHKQVALLITLPLLAVVITGICLQMRNQFEWIQPSTLVTERVNDLPILNIEQITEKLELKDKPFDQLIYQPKKNIISLRFSDGMEWQINPQTAEVLKRAQRRTGFLIELHQGSILGPFGQYGIYLLSSLGLLFLIISGVQLLVPKGR
ncbi:MAG: PepSY domain-containing protein [Bacteriovoracaceae bacterium]|nr:PepSY domain-containing protein [Bacteriovoracaceae bacterium]